MDKTSLNSRKAFGHAPLFMLLHTPKIICNDANTYLSGTSIVTGLQEGPHIPVWFFFFWFFLCGRYRLPEVIAVAHTYIATAEPPCESKGESVLAV